ncbi:MAG: hypothetical protein CMB99_01270 [Flavobacteriaceae bacterium]|nr:hypothetical protein [Flavobacteriaceae bacterium]|tara:strand:- start:425 stop:1498 length:1074 start_codon:yes stop_codon:yes gene_type:complete
MADWVAGALTVYERSGPEWTCDCPLCGREKLAINVARKAWQCWYCGFAGYSPTLLVAAVLSVPFEDAVGIVVAYGAGMSITPVGPLGAVTPHRPASAIPAATMPPGVVWSLLPTQAKYVAERGISPEHARLFGLGTVGGDRTRSKADVVLGGRVVFPVWAPSGRLVFWVARAVGESKVKTINMPRSCRHDSHNEWCVCEHEAWGLSPVPKAATRLEVVLGAHLITPGQPVYVVEGPVDAAVCGPGFVAVLGSSINPVQAALIAGSGASEAVILFDGDAPGAKGAAKAAYMLRRVMPVRIGHLPKGEDPGSLGRYRVLAIANSASPVGAIGALSAPTSGPRPQRISPPHPFLSGLKET